MDLTAVIFTFHRGALSGALPLELALFAEKLGAYSVNSAIDSINRKFVQDAHSRGLKVFVYTVNHPEELAWMRELGVDGVFTDFPDRIREPAAAMDDPEAR